MEKKRWSLIFIGLCLAVVFSVSSVEAQRRTCQPCQRCDRDGDGLIKNTGICINQCDPAMEMIDDDDADAVGMCSEEDGGIKLFTVLLEGPNVFSCVLNAAGDDCPLGPSNWGGKYIGKQHYWPPYLQPPAYGLGFEVFH